MKSLVCCPSPFTMTLLLLRIFCINLAITLVLWKSYAKSYEKLWKAMKKCTVLWGKVENVSDENREKVRTLLSENPVGPALQKLNKRKKFWNTSPDRFRFVLEEI